MPFPLFISQNAQDDLAEAYLYYESQRQGLGDTFIDELDKLLPRIADNPLSFPLIYGSKRRAVLSRFKFNIFFIFNQTEVQVLAILHGSRDPKRWQVR